MNPAKRAITGAENTESKKDAKIKKRLSFAPGVGTDEDDASSGGGFEADESELSPLSTKSVDDIHPKNLEQRFCESVGFDQAEQESVRVNRAEMESEEDTSPVFRSRRSLGSFQKADSSKLTTNESVTFCPNIKRTTWGLCYVRKDHAREVADPGKRKYKVPVVAFKDNKRTEFVNVMNTGNTTPLKILVVGEKADGTGIVQILEKVAAKMSLIAEITLSCKPVAEDIKGTHYYIFLVPLERTTCPKALSSVIPSIEKKTACVNLISCILLLPSLLYPQSSCDTLCPEDLSNLLEQYQMNSYTWPIENDKVDKFCAKLLAQAEIARGNTYRSSNLINWGLQRISIGEETGL